MTAAQSVAAATIVGVSAICVWLLSTALSPSRPVDGDRPNRLAISSIDLATGSQDAVFSARDLVPGDSASAAITVVNSGAETLRYAIHGGRVSAGSPALAAALILTVRAVGSSCPAFDGDLLYEGSPDALAAGDGVGGRLLPAATAEILCFRASLALDAGNDLQGLTTTVVVSFDASIETASP
jgi:hypothetical protein